MKRRAIAGVTLIELVVTMVIIGVLAALAGIYIAPALEAYFASQRRAELADVTDTAMRRMMRDIRLALPNSARIASSGGNRFLEILLTKNGGRYRAQNDNDAATTEDTLNFSAADSLFDTLGPFTGGADQQVQAGNHVVIHNLGIAGADAYDFAASPPNIARIQAEAAGPLADERRLTLAAANRFPLESPGRRFFVLSGPVTFACVGAGISGGNGTGSLLRWSGYTYDPGLPSPHANAGAAPVSLPANATQAVLANNVSACDLQYATVPLASRGLVAVRLAITRAGETVTLYYEAHVNNVP